MWDCLKRFSYVVAHDNLKKRRKKEDWKMTRLIFFYTEIARQKYMKRKRIYGNVLLVSGGAGGEWNFVV